MKTTLLALVLGAFMAQNGPLQNGVYAVEEGNAKAKTLVVRQFEGKDVVLDTADYAPLTLAAKPEVASSNGQSWLNIQLAPEAAKKLEDLTRSRIDHPIAVVVGDRILATPTVRTVITDGKARVTPCEDSSCETLLRQLSK